MINTIRADFYRLFYSKGFYITQLFLIVVIVLSIWTEALGSVGISGESLSITRTNSSSPVVRS